MLKVLIADDEVIICRMIEKLVDWKSKGMQVAGVFHNGLDLVDAMVKEKPDIVITDIRMPGLDGLQTVKKGIELGIKSEFIIMSGFKNFEYAHQALNMGVKHYILKPIDKDELNEVLSRISDELQENELLNKKEKNIEEREASGKIKIRKHFLNSIITQNSLWATDEQHENAVTEQCEFKNVCFTAILTKLDADKPISSHQSLLDIIDYQIEKTIDKDICEYVNAYVISGVVTVLNYDREKSGQIREMISRIMENCHNELDKFEGYHLTIGVGGEKQNIADMKEAISEAVDAVKCRIRKGVDKIIYISELSYELAVYEDIFTDRMRIDIIKDCDMLDKQAFLNDFGDAYEKIKKNTKYSPVMIFSLIDVVTGWIVENWKNNGVSEELLEDFKKKVEFNNDCIYKEEFLVFEFNKIISSFFERVKNEKIHKNQLPVRMAKQYIMQNYMRQLTLDEIANAIGLSAAYVSTLFKKEIGIGFSEYLTTYRMECAKKLLKDGQVSVMEIAEAVGYTDPKYFSKTFNKVVGLKPTEYRKMYQ